MTKLTNDSLVNVMTGLGMSHSKRAHNHYNYSYLNNYQQLEAAFQSDWLARMIVEAPVEDMTREWRDFKCKDGDKLSIGEKRIGLKHYVTDALRWARLYGGSGIVMLTDQPLDQPLNIERIRKGSLKRLIVFDRHQFSTPVMNTWDALAENFMLPSYYYVNGGSQRIHHSHVIRFTGASLPPRMMQQTLGWGDSELRKCIEEVADFTASKGGIAELLAEANVDIITREGLTDEIATDQENAITKRYAIFNQMKSIVQMALLDKEETYDRKTLNLSGIAPILDFFMVTVAGAAQTPVTRLFGTSAQGLNATGEGDMNNYYNHIRSKQTSQLDQSMGRLDEVFVRSTLGTMPEDFNYMWNPLHQLTDKEVQEALKLGAERDVYYLMNGVVTVSQVQRNLQQAETYQFDDADIEELAEAERMMSEPDEETYET